MTSSASGKLNPSQAKRDSIIVRPFTMARGRVGLTISAKVVREFGIIAEWLEYTLEVREGGILVYTPRARALPWAIGSMT